jgi:hypothetical protein
MNNASAFAKTINGFTVTPSPVVSQAVEKLQLLRRKIPGWSRAEHAIFFRCALAALGTKARVLVCGVYHGLDLALIEWAAAETKCEVELYGVDLFSDGPCEDWTPEQKARGSWQANGFGDPPSMESPSMESAQRNAPSAKLEKMNAYVWMLRKHTPLFDMIYLDTSHDRVTVEHEIGAARKILAPGGIICGDDYYEPNTGWGVDKAVQSLLPTHAVLANRIWISQ